MGEGVVEMTGLLLIILCLLWVFGGIYCMVIDWTDTLDVQGKDLPVIIIGGATIGPFVGLFHCTGELLRITSGKWWEMVFVKRRGLYDE